MLDPTAVQKSMAPPPISTMTANVGGNVEAAVPPVAHPRDHRHGHDDRHAEQDERRRLALQFSGPAAERDQRALRRQPEESMSVNIAMTISTWWRAKGPGRLR